MIKKMNAPEAKRRAEEIAKKFNSEYESLQSALFSPLIKTTHELLQKKGLIPMDNQPEQINELKPEVDIVAFTPEDVQAISSLPLSVIKCVVTEAQFTALTKFVNVNQTIMGLNEERANDA